MTPERWRRVAGDDGRSCQGLRDSERHRHGLDRPHEAIAAAWDSFDVTRGIGVVAEDVAKFFDGRIQGVVEIDESVLRPDPLAELLASDQSARLFKKGHENLERLLLAMKADTGLAKDAARKVQFKGGKTNHGIVGIGCTHGGLDVYDATLVQKLNEDRDHSAK